ncbi:MAG: oligosaccharide repeat unit polymerase [Synechococcales cyanobacterium C42_A2020_086]|jgi:oligosaccharide repeat unit polymerase|nr:oligosaccharide repeat unit polymerase [Synechococcales cyanobacterium M58_A2018_015]MBF2074595.1 oligosaccharide repeat unit polymerase [Synechococcales cyanobacterium C42_A2020_086]
MTEEHYQGWHSITWSHEADQGEDAEFDIEETEFVEDFRLYTPPSPAIAGTVCLLFGIALGYSLYPAEQTPSTMARVAAIAVGVAFLVSVFFDSRKGLRNLFRTDLLCLIGLYGLTLAEFLFPQEKFDDMVDTVGVANALNVVLVGIAGLAIGRHLVAPKPVRSRWLTLDEISNQTLFWGFILSAFLAYLYMLMSVNFDPILLIEEMLGPRFSQPWSRGRIGGWGSLLTELNLLSYVIPPLMAVVWNRRQTFPVWQLAIMTSIFSLVIFQAFAGGTRNVFIAHIATFLMSYLLTLPRNTVRNTILPILAAGFIAVYGSYHMLEFRTMGLRNYVTNQVYASGETRETLAVDYNLAAIAPLLDVFPESQEFLGFEVISWSLVRPIPRALFPGKPEGLSISIEDIVGAEGYTIATTYLGESYMMAGWLGVIGMSLFFGALAAWWNRMAMRQQSDYALVVYALGFFAAGITMRSMFWLTTAILPVIALIVFRKFTSR